MKFGAKYFTELRITNKKVFCKIIFLAAFQPTSSEPSPVRIDPGKRTFDLILSMYKLPPPDQRNSVYAINLIII